MKIPDESRKIWLQYNKGDFGDISASLNLNLSQKKGDLKISPRFMYTTTQNDDNDLQTPFAFKRVSQPGSTNEKWYIGAGSAVFVGGAEPDDPFVQDTATGTPNLGSASTPDLEIFASDVVNGEALFAASATLDRQDLDGADWDAITSLTNSGGGPFIKFAQRLYYKYDFRSIGSIDSLEVAANPSGTPNTVQYALRVLDISALSCGDANSDSIWLGTIAEKGQKAEILRWNGSSKATLRGRYKIPAQAILSIWIGEDDQPYCIDSKLVIWGFNGGTFVPLDRFPMKYNKKLASPSVTAVNRMVHYNGVEVAENGDVLILANPKYADGTLEKRAPAGVWIFNRENGLYHSGCMTLWDYEAADSLTDFGQLTLNTVGGIAITDSYDSTADGTVMAGASLDALSDKAAVFINNFNDTKQKAGYFETPFKYASEFVDSLQKLLARFKKFSGATDKIVVKYQTEENDPLAITFDWTTANSIVTSTNITNYSVGDEITIVTGRGGALCAHITQITPQGSDYNVEFDESFTNFSGSGTARLEKWKKSSSYTGTSANKYTFPISPNDIKIKLKVFIIATGDWYLHDLDLVSKTHQPSK